MAESFIDGSNANIDVSINSISYKSRFGYWMIAISRDMTERTVFAQGGWRARQPSLKQLTGRAEGYLTEGSAGSDPSLFFVTNAALSHVLTADTGCTFTFAGYETTMGAGMRAVGNSEFGINFESSATVTTAWVVA